MIEGRGFKVALQYRDRVGVHPSPEDFRPRLIGRGKGSFLFLVAGDGEYSSTKHYNRLRLERVVYDLRSDLYRLISPKGGER